MKGIINFSLNNRLLILAGWLLIVGFGVRALLRLPIDALPDVTNIQVQVLTNATGLPPEDVERFITFPVETTMAGLPKVEEIRSVSKFGLSVVTVVFEEGTDIYWARQLVGGRLTEAQENIPKSYGQPEIGPISTGLGEIVQFEVKGEGYSPMALRTLLDWTISYQLRGIPGVVEVNAFGGELKTYQVTLNPERMGAYGLAVGEVFEALRNNNLNVGGGYIAHQGEQVLIRGEGLVSQISDLEHIMIRNPHGGIPITVKDVASVSWEPMIRQGAVTRDGQGEAVIGIVMMLLGENSRVVSKDVAQKLSEIEKSLPHGVSIDIVYNRTELVNRTIKTVTKNLAEGGFLVVLVLLLLLGNLRGGLMVAAAIPLSMLAAFIAMNAMGISGNLMSLGALDFGLIVDGSVVLIENVTRYLSAHRNDPQSHLEKVRAACHEIARPVTFAVAIIILVYIPLLGLTGVEGKMFKPMALTVVFALTGSLVCALTLMPVLASFFLTRVRESEPLLFRWAKRVYQPLLKRSIRWPRLVMATSAGIFLASLSLAPFLGREFMPQLDEGSIAMQIWRLPSISLEKSVEISLQVEGILKREFPEIDTVISRTGRAEIATDPMGVEISDTYLMLKPRHEWRFKTKAQLVAAIDSTLKKKVAGATFSYSQPIQLRVAELISGVRSDVAVKVYGDDLATLKTKADEIAALLKTVPGAADVKAEQISGLPTMRVQLDRQALARYGIHAEQVLDVIETMGGKTVGVVLEGQRRFNLQVRMDADARAELGQVGDLLLAANTADHHQLIPLSQLANITVAEGPAQISRDNISRRISVEANVRGRDLGSFVAQAQQLLDEKLTLPNGWYLDWGGQFENLEAASKRLSMLVPLTLILIFLMLYSTFKSGSLAALIYLNVPMAITGGIGALALRGYPFSISAAVGFIALFGVAVLNGVVLLTTVVAKHDEGKPAAKAALLGAGIRLRPVLMTALVASLGFLPMALATGSGAEVQRPLATVVIGGLITSTLLTLLVLPTLYGFFFGRKDSGKATRGDQLPTLKDAT